MKKIITATIITSLIGSSVAYGVITNQNPEQIKEKKSVSVESAKTPIPSPETTPPPASTDVQNVVQNQQVQATSEPTKPAVPTIEELEVQYGWDKMAGGIQPYVTRWPEYFTESERQMAFQYMHDNGLAYCKKANLPSDELFQINYCWLDLVRRHAGDPNVPLWIRIGKMNGVDTSHYE